jgi:hypothetical protein
MKDPIQALEATMSKGRQEYTKFQVHDFLKSTGTKIAYHGGNDDDIGYADGGVMITMVVLMLRLVVVLMIVVVVIMVMKT